MTVSINGKPCRCEKGEFLLQVARRNGIHIPTLCHHESLPGQGCCRLCIVEVVERGRSRIVVSCVYPLERECEVFTDSQKVARQRGVILALLKKRAPDSQVIDGLCRQYDAPQMPRLESAEMGKCILCGLCVRACTELSVGAIATVNRGVGKEIATPYHGPSAVCVGCGSCAYICPTGAIDMVQTQETRAIWGKTFRLARCVRCGEVVGTEEELALSAERTGMGQEALCPNCREEAMARTLAHTYGE